ncbi:hypothetical protein [Nesterenkonia halophila]
MPRPDSDPPAAAAAVRPHCARELRRLRRSAAVLAGVSALLHLVMIGHGSTPAGLLMVGMAALCLPCAVHLWRSATVRAWAAVGAMNAGMLLVHGAMMRSAAGGHAVGDMVSAGADAPLMLHEVLMFGATVLSGTEVVLAGVGLAAEVFRRRRAASRTG